jgi:K+-transporting ATPase ATPase C chain
MKELFDLVRHGLAGLRTLLLLTLLVGLAYPLVITGIAQVALPWQADGSLLTASGAHTEDTRRAVGSALVGQRVAGDRAGAMFHPRPSAAGDGYDPLATGGSNLGPLNPVLVESIDRRRAAVARREGVAPGRVPPDAVTASASGLDPDISPAYAELQVPRVARANGLTRGQVRSLVDRNTSGRTWGVLGEPRVNVLELNLDVLAASGGA